MLVVLINLRGALLDPFKASPSCGNLDFYKTHGKIKERYYWPGMCQDIKKYVVSCNKCQRREALNVRRQGLTKPLLIAEQVFDTIGFDLITKLLRIQHNISLHR